MSKQNQWEWQRQGDTDVFVYAPPLSIKVELCFDWKWRWRVRLGNDVLGKGEATTKAAAMKAAESCAIQNDLLPLPLFTEQDGDDEMAAAAEALATGAALP